MKLLGIVGSLRAGSHNARLMDGVRVPDGVELEVFEGLGEIPPFDDTARPASVRALVDAIAAADAVLFATPEYNGSVPGVLKNALDWVSVPFETNALRNKPVAVVGTSTGMFGAVWAQAELRRILGLIGARVLDRDTPVPFAETSLEDGLEAVAVTAADLVALAQARSSASATATETALAVVA